MEDDCGHEAQLPEQTSRQDQPSEGQEKITRYAQARAQSARQAGLAVVSRLATASRVYGVRGRSRCG